MSPHNLLVLSDIHLGSDLVQHARPDLPRRSDASSRRDRELVALLDWYRQRPERGRPWRLVVAGDLVDFAGMSVSPTDEMETEPNDEERRHGLGSTCDHTLAKLRLVAEVHADVFAALARFVAAGNSLVIIRGNHDVDFHWEPVKAAFRDVLAQHGVTDRGSIDFRDWFYYEAGVVYIEHGHQYDSYCSYEHVLCPLMPSDPRRSYRSIADVLLRYVVRPTRGMKESGHDNAGALDYIRFGMKLGYRGLLGLGHRFAAAVIALLTLWREHFSDAAAFLRKEHERKMGMLAEAREISLVNLKALASLHRPPATRNLFKLLAGVMLDRVAFGFLGAIVLIWLMIASWTPTLGIVLAISIALLVPAAWLWRRARGSIDVRSALREQAARVGTLLPTAFVVMGHTHSPEFRQDGGGETYVNLGAWAEEEANEDGELPPQPASRTHLVLRYEDDRPVGALLAWDTEHGPKHFGA